MAPLQPRPRFTLIEVVVVVTIVLILAVFLLGSVIRAQHEARYTRWSAYKESIRTDPDVEAYYAFEEGRGNRLENLALGNPSNIHYRPTDRDGTIIGAQWEANAGRWTGKQALYFDGVDDHVALGLHYRRAQLDELTVMAWVKTQSTSSQAIISADPVEHWELGINGGGNLAFQWATTSRGSDDTVTSATLNSPAAYKPDQWQLIVGWYNRAGLLTDTRVIVDTEPRAEDKRHGGAPLGAGQARTTTYAFIGAGSQADTQGGSRRPGSYFKGYMDEVIIFHRALTDREILDHFKMGTL